MLFLDPEARPSDDARSAIVRRRRQLLRALRGGAADSFAGSKPRRGPLSLGCRLCGLGRWSCLFLNGFCNARCFFCPGLANSRSVQPHAERITFGAPAEYVAYVERLGFLGVSFSGGEPFLTPDKLLAYLEALRARLGRRLYIWAYTNGDAATAERLRAAARAGLDEVRFNIVASDYALDAVEAAVGVVPKVTVEIPAIPEDRERLQAVLPRLQAIGVDHVNLHQLMMMGQNGAALAGRGYTFGTAPTPPVLESELCALEHLRFAAERGLTLPIQYCGLTFKTRWQGRVEDVRAAPLVMRGHEALTATGLVRRLWLEASPEAAAAIAAGLRARAVDEALWLYSEPERRLYLHPSALASADAGEAPIRVQYLKTLVGEPAPPGWARQVPDYQDVALGPEKTIGVRLIPASAAIGLDRDQAASLAAGRPPAAIRCYEHIAAGL